MSWSYVPGLAVWDSASVPPYPEAASSVTLKEKPLSPRSLSCGMADGSIHPAPIWSDIRTFDGKPWRGVVDCVAGGIPCQPFSVAGKRRGTADERHLWPDVLRIVRECGPSVVFIENVGGSVRGPRRGTCLPRP